MHAAGCPSIYNCLMNFFAKEKTILLVVRLKIKMEMRKIMGGAAFSVNVNCLCEGQPS